MYGVSFTSFYRLSKTTGKATYIGPLYRNDANALVFDKYGNAYTEGVNHAELFTIDIKNGHASLVGSTYPYASAGDLTFYNGELVLSGYTGGSPANPNTLVELNVKTGKPIAASAFFASMWPTGHAAPIRPAFKCVGEEPSREVCALAHQAP